MLLGLLSLGACLLANAAKNCCNYAEGMRILEEQEKKSVWERARETKRLEINGEVYHNPVGKNLDLSEQYWNSGLERNEFVALHYLKFGRDGFARVPRIYERDGSCEWITGFDIEAITEEYLRKKLLESLNEHLETMKNAEHTAEERVLS